MSPIVKGSFSRPLLVRNICIALGHGEVKPLGFLGVQPDLGDKGGHRRDIL